MTTSIKPTPNCMPRRTSTTSTWALDQAAAVESHFARLSAELEAHRREAAEAAPVALAAEEARREAARLSAELTARRREAASAEAASAASRLRADMLELEGSRRELRREIGEHESAFRALPDLAEAVFVRIRPDRPLTRWQVTARRNLIKEGWTLLRVLRKEAEADRLAAARQAWDDMVLGRKARR